LYTSIVESHDIYIYIYIYIMTTWYVLLVDKMTVLYYQLRNVLRREVVYQW